MNATRPTTLLFAIVLSAAACVPQTGGAPAPAAPAPAPAAPGGDPAPGWREDMLARINTLRAGVGAQPVALCQALHHSAVAHATDMVTNRFFDHKGSDGSTLAVRVDRTTYGRWTYLAENIAAGQRSVEQVMNGWINSPGHYANLTSTNVTHVGLGFIQSSGSPYGTYWVQNFGTSGTC